MNASLTDSKAEQAHTAAYLIEKIREGHTLTKADRKFLTSWIKAQPKPPIPKKSPYTLIGHTKDGKPVYWGKKESNRPRSEDLDLWVTVEEPKRDGSNYRRVPIEAERHLHSFYQSNASIKAIGDKVAVEWPRYIAGIVANLNGREILTTWEDGN